MIFDQIQDIKVLFVAGLFLIDWLVAVTSVPKPPSITQLALLISTVLQDILTSLALFAVLSIVNSSIVTPRGKLCIGFLILATVPLVIAADILYMCGMGERLTSAQLAEVKSYELLGALDAITGVGSTMVSNFAKGAVTLMTILALSFIPHILNSCESRPRNTVAHMCFLAVLAAGALLVCQLGVSIQDMVAATTPCFFMHKATIHAWDNPFVSLMMVKPVHVISTNKVAAVEADESFISGNEHYTRMPGCESRLVHGFTGKKHVDIPSKPNVLVFIIESMRFHEYSGLRVPVGNETKPLTPNIRNIRREGLSWSNYFTVNFNTNPSYLAMDTGRFAERGGGSYDDMATSIFDVLRDEGYRSVRLNPMGFNDSPLVEMAPHNESMTRSHPDSYYNVQDMAMKEAIVDFWSKNRETPLYFEARTIGGTHLPLNIFDQDEAYFEHKGWNEGLREMAYKYSCEISNVCDETYIDYYVRYMKAHHLADRFIGQTISALRDLNLLEKTAIVITGDHGQGFVAGITEVSKDESYHVPFVIAGDVVNRWARGRKIEDVHSNLDFGPTLLDMIGATEYNWHGIGTSMIRHRFPDDQPCALSFHNSDVLMRNDTHTTVYSPDGDVVRFKVYDRRADPINIREPSHEGEYRTDEQEGMRSLTQYYDLAAKFSKDRILCNDLHDGFQAEHT